MSISRLFQHQWANYRLVPQNFELRQSVMLFATHQSHLVRSQLICGENYYDWFDSDSTVKSKKKSLFWRIQECEVQDPGCPYLLLSITQADVLLDRLLYTFSNKEFEGAFPCGSLPVTRRGEHIVRFQCPIHLLSVLVERVSHSIRNRD